MTNAFDLAIDGGLVHGAGTPRVASVYARNGTVAAVTAGHLRASHRVDATGLLVMPGMVDAHVHLMEPSAPDREDYPHGTAAAAVAGVTTIIEHTHSGPVRRPADLEAKVAALHDRALVDFALAAHAWPGESAEVAPLWRAGVAFFKAFTCTTHGIPGHDPAQLADLLSAVAAVDAACLVHCEDESLTELAARRLRAEGREDNGVIPVWRSREAEMVAVAVATTLARETAARTVIAHASNAGVVELVGRQRTGATSLAVETCPQYMTLMENEILSEGAFRKFTPPARARSVSDLAEMWRLVAAGAVDYVSSDHAPSTAAQKREGSIWDAHFGLPGLDTTMPLLLTAAAAGKLTYERLVEVYATVPAELYRLRGKGALVAGYDADIIVVDPHTTWQLATSDLHSKAGWSPYAGRTMVGRTVATYLRGELVAADGGLVAAPGTGRFVPGPGMPVGGG
jgi:dihydroorotase (multifunctional complex type)